MNALCFHGSLRAALVSTTLVSAGAAVPASAAIVTFTDPFLYESYTAGWSRPTESFESMAGASGATISGTAGGGGVSVQWAASSTGIATIAPFGTGLVLTTASSAPLSVSFTGATVQAISGNFFGRDPNSDAGAVVLNFMLADGSSSVSLISAPLGFFAFVSTGAAFESITLSPPFGSAVTPIVDNLGFGVVPSPGAAALLGLAGLARSRRR